MKKVFKATYLLLAVVALLLTFLLFNNKSYSLKYYDRFNEAFSYLLILKKTNSVSFSHRFQYINGNQYTNDEKKVYPLNNGTIIKTTNSEIVLKTINGFIVRYCNLINVNVKVYDFVTKNDELAYFIDYFECQISKGEKFYTYEEYIKNNW